MEDTSFHEKVRAAYLELAQSDTTGRWKIIDANKSLTEVSDAVWSAVQEQTKP